MTAIVFRLARGRAVYASGNALPGDGLYPLKLAAEQTQLAISHSDTGDARLRLVFAQKRLEEAQRLISAGQRSEVPIALEGFAVEVDGVVNIATITRTADNRQALAAVLNEALATDDKVLSAVEAQALPEAWSAVQEAQEAVAKAMG
jgi:uncharacterized protein DUF5667